LRQDLRTILPNSSSRRNAMLAPIALGTTMLLGLHPAGITIQTRYVTWTIGPDGRNLTFRDHRTGKDWLHPASGSVAFFASRQGVHILPTSVTRHGDRVDVVFGQNQTSVVFTVRETSEAIFFEIASISGDLDELTFGTAPLTLRGLPEEPIAVCALARNLKTNVPELPGASSMLRAIAYRRLRFEGASAAFIAVPPAQLRRALQRVVEASPELPKSPVGGPWALDSPDNHRSYLFNFGGLNASTAGPWIELAHALGATQIDFHGGTSFRFGDFQPDPKTYPQGIADLKAAVDTLHASGLKAGLHTYSFFIDKRSKYVTPLPDPRLAYSRSFTVAEPVDAQSDTITVQEPTTGVTAQTGFFVPNSATLRIGEELITFREATQTPPYRFLGCVRGALGTRASAHKAGEKAYHLKELFGLFVPDANTNLFLEIVENTARTYNDCGFDMIYLDALDGSFIHDGPEWAWYYGAKFVYELFKRLRKPPIMEMSTFHHHLWVVRSRMGAWDAPHTGYKEFVDMHRVVNRDCQRMFLPSHLGWWGVFEWNGVQPDRTFPDDVEYLMGKALADNAGVSFVHGFSPDTFGTSPGARRYAALIRRYEELRKSRRVPVSLRRRLAEPGAEFTLEQIGSNKYAFVPVRYQRSLPAELGAQHLVQNPFAPQPLSVRVEALLSAGSPDEASPLLTPEAAVSIAPRSASGVAVEASLANLGPPAQASRKTSLRICAKSDRSQRRGSWAVLEHVFPTPVNLTGKGLGVWIHGDGKGEVLNFQLRNPESVSPAAAEHYVVVDFIGWRYVTLVEPESDRLSHYSWPYAAHRSEWEKNPGLAFTSAYKTYHPWLNYSVVGALSIWLNEIPPGETVECLIGPVCAVPLEPGQIANPTLTVADKAVTVPVVLQSGDYVELAPDGTARVYGPRNEEKQVVRCERGLPIVPPGEFSLQLTCQPSQGRPPRARLTTILRGNPIRF